MIEEFFIFLIVIKLFLILVNEKYIYFLEEFIKFILYDEYMYIVCRG